MYLERRRRKWYALHDVPADVQGKIGTGRFCKSLGTEDHTTAKMRAARLEAQWRAEIERVRAGTGWTAERKAAFWRREVEEAKPGEDRDLVLDALRNELEPRVQKAAMAAGLDHPDAEWRDLPEYLEAKRIYDIAAGRRVPWAMYLDEFIEQLGNEAKTKEMKRSTIKRFGEAFPFVQSVTRSEVEGWFTTVAGEQAVKTRKRVLSELRTYWTYLVKRGVAVAEPSPFEKLTFPQARKRAAEGEREPFDAADVVKLLHAADRAGDGQLADLIRLGMWTGARIEELCSLKVDAVGEWSFRIAEAKTPAGNRTVPIHPSLAPILRRLSNTSTSGFVIDGLKPNKYGDRSNAIGKRFGRLKTELGFGGQYVFHSIRKTVATLLENAGVPENVTADILGHEKPRITYGLYSGGASLETKREAIAHLRYP